MIEILEGAPGGGKTFCVVMLWFVPQWLKGGTVCTNVEVKWPEMKSYCKEKYGADLQDQQLMRFDTVADKDKIGSFQRFTPSGTRKLPVLCVWDEAHKFWNARAWSETMKKYPDTFDFLTTSRHFHTDVAFITQHHKNLDSQVARLIQYRWTFRDLAKIRIGPIGYPFPTTLAVQYDYDGKTVIRRIFYRRKPEVFNLYESHSHADNDKRSGQVEAVDVGKKQRNIPWDKIKLWGIVLALVGGLGWAWSVLRRPATELVPLPKLQATASSSPAAVSTSQGGKAASAKNLTEFQRVDPDGTFVTGYLPESPSLAPQAVSRPRRDGLELVMWPLVGYMSREGHAKFIVDTDYGRMTVSVGDICPPYELLALRGSREIPELYALDVNRNLTVILMPFLQGKNQNQLEKNQNQDGLINVLDGYQRRLNGRFLPGSAGQNLQPAEVPSAGGRLNSEFPSANGFFPDIQQSGGIPAALSGY